VCRLLFSYLIIGLIGKVPLQFHGSEKYHYNSPIVKYAITILTLSKICHGLRLSSPWAQLQCYSFLYGPKYLCYSTSLSHLQVGPASSLPFHCPFSLSLARTSCRCRHLREPNTPLHMAVYSPHTSSTAVPPARHARAPYHMSPHGCVALCQWPWPASPLCRQLRALLGPRTQRVRR
jgi:hypothetical protein